MGMLSDYSQNFLIDAMYRGGALNAAGTVNSTATVKGVWAATTAYAVGDTIVPPSTFTAGGGKFLRCTTAGTSGSTTTLACPAVGSTLADGSVTWTAVSGVPCPSSMYVTLLTCTKGARASSTAYALNDTIALTANDTKIHYYKCTTAGTTAASQSTLYPGAANEAITDGTAVFTEQTAGMDSNSAILVEASGAGFSRVALNAALANWAGTQSSASTTTSSGIGGQTSNNSTITFGTPTASWQPAAGVIWGFGVFDQLTGGNLLDWGPLLTVQTVLNGQAAPSIATSALTLTLGN
jgi:hypothetical protein